MDCLRDDEFINGFLDDEQLELLPLPLINEAVIDTVPVSMIKDQLFYVEDIEKSLIFRSDLDALYLPGISCKNSHMENFIVFVKMERFSSAVTEPAGCNRQLIQRNLFLRYRFPVSSAGKEDKKKNDKKAY